MLSDLSVLIRLAGRLCRWRGRRLSRRCTESTILLCSKSTRRIALHHVLLLLHHLPNAGGFVVLDVVDELPLLVFLPIVNDVDSHARRRAGHSGEPRASALQTQTGREVTRRR